MVRLNVSFKDLSWPCKVGVIGGWVCILVYLIYFIIGIVIGMTMPL